MFRNVQEECSIVVVLSHAYRISCIAVTGGPEGVVENCIIAGFTNGSVQIFSALSLDRLSVFNQYEDQTLCPGILSVTLE